MLRKNPLIFGLCVAIEPYAWRKDRADFALYVYRRREGLAVKQLLPPGYRPVYRQWEWYRAARDSPQGRWSEPYIGEGGDRTPMVTFSARSAATAALSGSSPPTWRWITSAISAATSTGWTWAPRAIVSWSAPAAGFWPTRWTATSSPARIRT